MDKKNKLISKVLWTIDSNPNDAYIFASKKSIKEEPIPPEILNIKLRGKRIVLLYDSGTPILTTPFVGNTFSQWMKCLYEGVNKTIMVEELSMTEVELIYKRIGGWFVSNIRSNLVKKLESNKLKISELLGNHVYFEGCLKLEKGTWYYSLGS
jgi:hypothetical protein